jgi:hypothetical protein
MTLYAFSADVILKNPRVSRAIMKSYQIPWTELNLERCENLEIFLADYCFD